MQPLKPQNRAPGSQHSSLSPPHPEILQSANLIEVGGLGFCPRAGAGKVVIHTPAGTAGGTQASVSPPVLAAFGVPGVPEVGGCLSVRPSALTFLSLFLSPFSLSFSFLFSSLSLAVPFLRLPSPHHAHSSLPVHPGQSMVERGLGLPLVKTFVLRWVRACAARHPHAVPGACAPLPPPG